MYEYYRETVKLGILKHKTNLVIKWDDRNIINRKIDLAKYYPKNKMKIIPVLLGRAFGSSV